MSRRCRYVNGVMFHTFLSAEHQIRTIRALSGSNIPRQMA